MAVAISARLQKRFWRPGCSTALKTMLLTIDVGNTETKLGCFANGSNELAHAWRITTDSKRTADETGTLFRQLFAAAGASHEMEAIVIASVVPNLDQTLSEA